MARKKPREEPAQIVLKAFGDRKKNHEAFCAQVEKNRRAYHAIVDQRSNAAQWTSKLTPPYAMQVADTVVANLTEDRVVPLVRPCPHMGQDYALYAEGARANELLLKHQLSTDHFHEKQAIFAMQSVIAGMSVAKVYWDERHEVRKSLVRRDTPIYGESGEIIDEVSTYEEVEYPVTSRDDPTVEIVRVDDFMWEEGVPSFDKSSFAIHRVATTRKELERLQKLGVYKNVAKLDERDDIGGSDEWSSLEEDLSGDRRFKDKIELLEYWSCDRLITLANRRVVIRDEPNPFWHGRLPFVVMTTAPNLWQVPGRSIVGRIAQLQEYLWSLLNQRLDNLQLINNAVFAVRSDFIDRDELEFFPGAMWRVDGPVNEAVQMFAPNPVVAQISLEAEALMKGDLQNVTGGMPFMSGTNSGTIDQQTATGVSIVTSLAQRMLAHQKQFVTWAYERIFQLMLELNQQYIRQERVIQTIGMDGAMAFHELQPELLQGMYQVQITPQSESLQRQERRAEALQLLNTFAQLAPILQVTGAAVNMRALAEDTFRSFDRDDIDKYFTAQPQQGLQGVPGLSPMGGGQQGPGNVTNAALAAGPTSPSNQASISPEVFMQRAGAMSGNGQGGANY